MCGKGAMRAATRDAFESELLDFVNRSLAVKRRVASAQYTAIHRSTRLFESGVVDSLGILDLIAFVEEATCRTIPMRMIDLKHFGTVGRISASFWRGKQDE